MNSINKNDGIKFRFLNKSTWTAPSLWAMIFFWEYLHFTNHIAISCCHCPSAGGILPPHSLRGAAPKPLVSQHWIAVSEANHLPNSTLCLVNRSQTLKPSWWNSLLHREGSRCNTRGVFQPSKPCLALLLWVVLQEISRITQSRRKLIIS